MITRVLTLEDTIDPSDADYLLDRLSDVLERAPVDEAGRGAGPRGVSA